MRKTERGDKKKFGPSDQGKKSVTILATRGGGGGPTNNFESSQGRGWGR